MALNRSYVIQLFSDDSFKCIPEYKALYMYTYFSGNLKYNSQLVFGGIGFGKLQGQITSNLLTAVQGLTPHCCESTSIN